MHIMDGLQRARHIGTLGNELNAICNQKFGVGSIQLILCRTGEGQGRWPG